VVPIAHWDDVQPARREIGHIAGSWIDLGRAAGSVGIGVRRIRVDPGKWSTPAHVELAEEESFFVLAGSGLSWQDGETFDVGPGDCLVHLIETQAHTLRAGPDGLDVLAFGMRIPAGGTLLPRAGVIWHWPGWAEAPLGRHPYEREAEAGEPELPAAPAERPRRIVALDAVPALDFGRPGQVEVRDLGRAAGSQLTGLRHVRLAEGAEGAPPHCHAAEEELFVVLSGHGVCTLGDEQHEVRAGHVVARPPGTGVPHSFTAGERGLAYLAYGTRVPSDIVYYPRTREVSLRGVGVRFALPADRQS
jgi:uncharacterized cupin superfamily protein